MPKNLGTLITSTIRPLSQNSGIATVLGNEIKGGYHVVSTLSDRNLISVDRRTFGMLVYVTTSDEFYQLKTINSTSVSDNLNWSLVNLGGSIGASEWLNSVISRSSVPPMSPNTGDRYLVVSGTGVWTGFDDIIVEWNGTSWQSILPTEGVTIRVDDEIESLYSYVGDDFNLGYWKRLDFSEFQVKYEITSSESVDIATYSQYLVYGDLQLDGQIENWGQLVVINGGVTGSGTLSGGGSLIQPEFLTEVYGATGLQISASGSYDRIVSLDIVSGTGISLNSIGNQVEISLLSSTFSEGYPQYIIESSDYVSVPDNRLYFIYGDLTVGGTLDIGTYGKVVVVNGSLITTTGSVINNLGNLEIYNIPSGVTGPTGPSGVTGPTGPSGVSATQSYITMVPDFAKIIDYAAGSIGTYSEFISPVVFTYSVILLNSNDLLVGTASIGSVTASVYNGLALIDETGLNLNFQDPRAISFMVREGSLPVDDIDNYYRIDLNSTSDNFSYEFYEMATHSTYRYAHYFKISGIEGEVGGAIELGFDGVTVDLVFSTNFLFTPNVP
jgi:hypothetical protein